MNMPTVFQKAVHGRLPFAQNDADSIRNFYAPLVRSNDADAMALCIQQDACAQMQYIQETMDAEAVSAFDYVGQYTKIKRRTTAAYALMRLAHDICEIADVSMRIIFDIDDDLNRLYGLVSAASLCSIELTHANGLKLILRTSQESEISLAYLLTIQSTKYGKLTAYGMEQNRQVDGACAARLRKQVASYSVDKILTPANRLKRGSMGKSESQKLASCIAKKFITQEALEFFNDMKKVRDYYDAEQPESKQPEPKQSRQLKRQILRKYKKVSKRCKNVNDAVVQVAQETNISVRAIVQAI